MTKWNKRLADYVKLEYNNPMRIYSFKAIREFIVKHPNAETGLRTWFKQIFVAEYHCFQDILNDFGAKKVDKVGDLYIFDIAGNHYRLIAAIHFNRQKVYIREILTHAEYDKNKWKK
jgi:mRNA interferase HigB